jgi:hypothetical protein
MHEDNLAAAGFIVRPANTPERRAMLKRLPSNRFIMRTEGDDNNQEAERMATIGFIG